MKRIPIYLFLFILAFQAAIPTAARADAILVLPLGVIADRATLEFTLGEVDGQFALKASFGSALSNRSIGIVFVEKPAVHGQRIDAALDQLVEHINSSTAPTINLKDLAPEIGLTFRRFVRASQVEVEAFPESRSPG